MTQRHMSVAPLSEAQASFGFTPAVQDDDITIDFERLAESADWLSGDLEDCGLVPGCRVALAVQSGWEFVLTWHTLVALGAAVVPVELCDDAAVRTVRDIGIDFLLTHESRDDVVEDAVDELADQHRPFPEVFQIAEVFTLVATRRPGGDADPGGESGGWIEVWDGGSRVVPIAELVADASDLADRLGLWTGRRVRIPDTFDTRSSAVTVLACALSGTCVCVDHADADDDDTDLVVRAGLDDTSMRRRRSLRYAS